MYKNCIAMEELAQRVLTREDTVQEIWTMGQENHGPKPWVFVGYDPFRKRYERPTREDARQRLFAMVHGRPGVNFAMLTRFPHHSWFISPWKEPKTWPTNVMIGVQPDKDGDLLTGLTRLGNCGCPNVFWYLPYGLNGGRDYRPYLESWVKRYPNRKPWIVIDKMPEAEDFAGYDWAIYGMHFLAKQLGCDVWLNGLSSSAPDTKTMPKMQSRVAVKLSRQQECREWNRKHGPVQLAEGT